MAKCVDILFDLLVALYVEQMLPRVAAGEFRLQFRKLRERCACFVDLAQPAQCRGEMGISPVLAVRQRNRLSRPFRCGLEVFEQEMARLETAVGQRDRLLSMDARLNRLLWSVAGGWMLVLGGGVFLLRRRRLI